jgi:hypothetical protein
MLDTLAELNVEAVAISMEREERAQKSLMNGSWMAFALPTGSMKRPPGPSASI